MDQHTGHLKNDIQVTNLVYLYTLIEANPTISLNKVHFKLAGVHNLRVSLATISRSPHLLAFTRKAVLKQAPERNEELQTVRIMCTRGDARPCYRAALAVTVTIYSRQMRRNKAATKRSFTKLCKALYCRDCSNTPIVRVIRNLIGW